MSKKFQSEDQNTEFAALLNEQGAVENKRLRVGDRVKGKVFHISKDTVFCQVSGTQEGSIPLPELLDDSGALRVRVGDTVDTFVTSVDDGIRLSSKLSRHSVDATMLEQAKESRIPIEGVVTGVNKGGLEVSVGGSRGFCPLGQADINFIEDAQTLVGKTLSFLIREVKEGGRSVVLSRRALLEAERKEKSVKIMQNLAVGQRISGVVTRIAAFGAFVDLGGVDGLIPVSELSHSHAEKVEDVVAVGQTVEVEVLRIENDPKHPGQSRIALSLKATLPDPFAAHSHALFEGNTLTGKVVRIESFGAFVEIFPGVQGLVHVSELSSKRVRHPGDVVTVGQEVTARVLRVEKEAHRVALSLRDVSGEAANETVSDYTPPTFANTLGDSMRVRAKRK